MQNRKMYLVGLGAILCSLPVVAHGEIVTFVMEGSVQTVDDPNGTIDFAQVGDRVLFSITLDSETPPSATGWMQTYPGISGLAKIGDTQAVVSLPVIAVEHKPTAPFTQNFTMASDVEIDGHSGLARFYLNNYTTGQLPYDLPTEAYPLSDFESTTFSMSLHGPSPVSGLRGEIDRFYLIPEPTALVLLALGGLAASRRRRG